VEERLLPTAADNDIAVIANRPYDGGNLIKGLQRKNAPLPAWYLLLLPIPLLWTATSAATLDSFAAPFAMTLPVIAAITVAAATWKAIYSK